MRALGAVLVGFAALLIVAVLVYLLAVVPGQRQALEPLVTPGPSANPSTPASTLASVPVGTPSPGATPVAFSQLTVGICLLDSHVAADGTISVDEMEAIDCSSPHYEEVIYLGQLADRAFPGQDALIEELDHVCFGEFATYVGIGYPASTLLLDYLYPTETSWNAGDRAFACSVYGPEDLVGSVAGTAR